MNEKSSDAALLTGDPVAPTRSAFAEKAKRVFASAKDGAEHAAHGAVDMGKATGEQIAHIAESTRVGIGKAAVLVGDLNGDGKVDHEDAKIAVAKVKELASKTAYEAGTLARDVAKNDMVKDAAAGAAIGALVAVPIPFIGPAGGASIGAIAGVVKSVLSPSNKK